MRRNRSNHLALLRAILPLLLVAAAWRALNANDLEAMAMKFLSPAFAEGTAIPEIYTCDGKDVSPPLAWSELPEGTRSLALLIEDPDAPDPAAPQRNWVHWVLYNIPPGTAGLAEGASAASLPAGTGQGLNDWNRTGYGGPCPPIGRHRYFHRLFALDTVFPDLGTPNRLELYKAMEGHILAQAQFIGTFQRR